MGKHGVWHHYRAWDGVLSVYTLVATVSFRLGNLSGYCFLDGIYGGQDTPRAGAFIWPNTMIYYSFTLLPLHRDVFSLTWMLDLLHVLFVEYPLPLQCVTDSPRFSPLPTLTIPPPLRTPAQLRRDTLRMQADANNLHSNYQPS